MGVIKPWTSNYPATVDDVIPAGSMPTLVDGTDDVIASHPNSIATSLIELEQENFAYKDNNTSAGATNYDILDTDRNAEIVIGSVLFDAERLEHLVPTFRLLGTFVNGAAAGDAHLRLYDMGAPGTPLAPPELRSEVTIPNALGGGPQHVSVVLSPVVAPGIDLDEVFLGVRIYEIRAELASPTAGDTFKILWGGVSLGLSQP
jgi:hypothetical protein